MVPVTPTEARAHLGLAGSGPLLKSELRRAYLQAIKKHKPEADPEGFQRVREAYELLDRLLVFGAPAEAAGAGETSATPASPDEPDQGGEPDQGAEPDGSHLEPYRERLRQMFGLPWQQRAEVGWAAYESFPGDVGARELLLALLPAEARAEVVGILLEGVRTGDGSCLYRLLIFAPEAVPLEELERLESHDNPYKRLLAAQARIERGEVDRGLVVAESLLSSTPEVAPDPGLVGGTVELVLRLEARGDVERAALLRGCLYQHLGGPRLPADGADSELAALFAVSSELGAVGFLPAGVRSALARGAVAGRFEGLPPALAQAERELGRGPLERTFERLEREAPTLHAIVHPYRYPRRLAEPFQWGRSWWAVWLGTLLVLGAISRGGSCLRSPSPPIDRARLAALEEHVLRANDVPRSKPPLPLALFRAQVRSLCDPPVDQTLCGSMPSYLRSLEAGASCGPARKQLQLYRDAVQAVEARAFVDNLAAALPELCSP